VAQIIDFSKDDLVITRAAKRLLRAKKRLKSWRAVGIELGVNHGYPIALVNHGKVPANTEYRLKLGLPRVMPSEQKTKVKKIIPLLGSACWQCMAFKKLKPRKWRGQ
jgi:hypothetical protein